MGLRAGIALGLMVMLLASTEGRTEVFRATSAEQFIGRGGGDRDLPVSFDQGGFFIEEAFDGGYSYGAPLADGELKIREIYTRNLPRRFTLEFDLRYKEGKWNEYSPRLTLFGVMIGEYRWDSPGAPDQDTALLYPRFDTCLTPPNKQHLIEYCTPGIAKYLPIHNISIVNRSYSTLSRNNLAIHKRGDMGYYVPPDTWTHFRIDVDADRRHTSLMEPLMSLNMPFHSQNATTPNYIGFGLNGRKGTQLWVRNLVIYSDTPPTPPPPPTPTPVNGQLPDPESLSGTS